MDKLPYKLEITKRQLTSSARFLAVVHPKESLALSTRIDYDFSRPKSNWGFKSSAFIQTLMQLEGSFYLDDVCHLKGDHALRTMMGIRYLYSVSTLGDWFIRTGC